MSLHRPCARAPATLVALLVAGAAQLGLLTACSSLERSDQLKTVKLSNQISNKTQVVNAIGLPRTIERDEEKGVEIWHYTGKPMNTSYFVPVPVAAAPAGGGMTTVFTADVGKKLVEGKDPVILTLVFDKTGQLIQLLKPNSQE